MKLFTTILAILLLADAAFALLNLGRVESLIKEVFPQMDIKKIAIVEGIVGLLILLLKASTNSFV